MKFQRTRGVLRLMAAVIHSLWQAQDRNPLIMPANIPLDDQPVRDELTRYLPDNWVPVIERDVDGAQSLPIAIDKEIGNLGRFAATRRVARTIFLGSAPTTTAAHHGIEDRQVNLGCVMPGEPAGTFGDALRRLSAAATYLYQEGPRYWYATQPTVTKLAEDQAELLKRNKDKVERALRDRLVEILKLRGDFARVHLWPASSQEVPDDVEAALVVLHPEKSYTKDAGNEAEKAAKDTLAHRGNAPRINANSLVFLAAESNRYHELDEALRRALAWASIVADHERLNLSASQLAQAKTRQKDADSVVDARIPETYQPLLVPTQGKAADPVGWTTFRLTASDPLAVRASKKLRSEELLFTALAGSRLRVDLDKVPLWRNNGGSDVSIKQLLEDFARYIYLPRLKDSSVLFDAIANGVSLMTWRDDGFGYADSFDPTTNRYRGLRAGSRVFISDANLSGLVVKWDIAEKQLQAEAAPPSAPATPPTIGGAVPSPYHPISGPAGAPIVPPTAVLPKRFHGTVSLEPTRVGRDAGKIADEIISHLTTLTGAKVTVTLEIQADLPSGAPENIVRTVTENSLQLKFTSQGFEKE